MYLASLSGLMMEVGSKPFGGRNHIHLRSTAPSRYIPFLPNTQIPPKCTQFFLLNENYMVNHFDIQEI